MIFERKFGSALWWGRRFETQEEKTQHYANTIRTINILLGLRLALHIQHTEHENKPVPKFLSQSTFQNQGCWRISGRMKMPQLHSARQLRDGWSCNDKVGSKSNGPMTRARIWTFVKDHSGRERWSLSFLENHIDGLRRQDVLSLKVSLIRQLAFPSKVEIIPNIVIDSHTKTNDTMNFPFPLWDIKT